MKRIRVAGRWAAGLALIVVAAGFWKPKPVLHVYNWADYVKPELVTRFEKEHKCRVMIDTFDSNEAMYAKLKAGAKGYDLIFPSSYMVNVMRQQDMLLPIDHARVPNIVNLDPAYMRVTADAQCRFSVPYMISNAGLAYRKSKVPDFQPSWSMLDRTNVAGRVTMLNDMRETIGAALKFLGYSLNTTSDKELEAARDVVIRWKKNLAKFENEQYKNGIASGEFLLVHGYNGDIRQVMEENEDIGYAAPREGVSLACDEMVIPKGARQVELAHAFINFLHDPKVAAENTEFIFYLCPNKPSYEFLGETIKNDASVFLPADLQAKSEVIRDLGADNAKYTRIWDQIKAAP
jgi:spermidine/putrescine transport system substrate-binding protein